jgi:hypothetical protein
MKEFKPSPREEQIRAAFMEAAKEDGEPALSGMLGQAIAEIVGLIARVEELEDQVQLLKDERALSRETTAS